MKQRKIYVVGGDTGYANWMQGQLVTTMEQADLVLFTGGEDVTPSLYGAKRNPRTGNNVRRDDYEAPLFRKAVKLGKKIIGICRGAQLACALSGGKLVQHQGNPSYMHSMSLTGGGTVQTTSSHHQAQFPWDIPSSDWNLIAYTTGISDIHEGENAEQELVNNNGKNAGIEVEVAVYYKTQALAIQGHPEWITDLAVLKYYRDLLDSFMEGKL